MFGEAAPRAGQDEPGSREVVAVTEDEVRGEVAGRPRREKSRRLGTELLEQVGEPRPFDAVEELVGHGAGV